MIKGYLILLPAILISAISCSSMEDYDAQKNCSKNALDYIAHPPKKAHNKPNTPITPEAISKLKNLLESSTQKMQACYQEFLDQGHTQDYNVCLVAGTDDKGKIAFVDIDDRANKLDDQLQKCMYREVNSLNFTPYKNITVTQPYRLRSKR